MDLRHTDAPPDTIGVNHYVTSDRYLDTDLSRYSPEFAGGNGQDRYADVEAARIVPPPGALGPEARLKETWDRYGRPIVVTEAHLGCEDLVESVRWLREIWEAATRLRASGVDVRAVMVWSLFGAIDWRSLLRQRDGAYERGAFDVRPAAPRPTALAQAVEGLLRQGRIADPAAYQPGWWRRPERAYLRTAALETA